MKKTNTKPRKIKYNGTVAKSGGRRLTFIPPYLHGKLIDGVRYDITLKPIEGVKD